MLIGIQGRVPVSRMLGTELCTMFVFSKFIACVNRSDELGLAETGVGTA